MKSPYPEELEAWGYSKSWHSQFELKSPGGCFPARVVRDHRGYFRVHTAKGELIATTAGRLKHNAAHASDLPAVGDFVALKEVREEGHRHGRGVIQLVLPRLTAFKRKAAGHLTEEQIVASNIDTVFIVCGVLAVHVQRKVGTVVPVRCGCGRAVNGSLRDEGFDAVVAQQWPPGTLGQEQLLAQRKPCIPIDSERSDVSCEHAAAVRQDGQSPIHELHRNVRAESGSCDSNGVARRWCAGC